MSQRILFYKALTLLYDQIYGAYNFPSCCRLKWAHEPSMILSKMLRFSIKRGGEDVRRGCTNNNSPEGNKSNLTHYCVCVCVSFLCLYFYIFTQTLNLCHFQNSHYYLHNWSIVEFRAQGDPGGLSRCPILRILFCFCWYHSRSRWARDIKLPSV